MLALIIDTVQFPTKNSEKTKNHRLRTDIFCFHKGYNVKLDGGYFGRKKKIRRRSYAEL